MALHECFGKRLAALNDGSFLGRPETGDVLRSECIRQSLDQGFIGADDCKLYMLAQGVADDGCMVGQRKVDHGAKLLHSSIPSDCKQHNRLGGFEQCLCQGVFTAAAADDEDAHANGGTGGCRW